MDSEFRTREVGREKWVGGTPNPLVRLSWRRGGAGRELCVCGEARQPWALSGGRSIHRLPTTQNKTEKHTQRLLVFVKVQHGTLISGQCPRLQRRKLLVLVLAERVQRGGPQSTARGVCVLGE